MKDNNDFLHNPPIAMTRPVEAIPTNNREIKYWVIVGESAHEIEAAISMMKQKIAKGLRPYLSERWAKRVPAIIYPDMYNDCDSDAKYERSQTKSNFSWGIESLESFILLLWYV